MDRIRELHHSKSASTNKIGGKHKEKGTSKLVSPNVVARLMGLDGFPSPEVIHRSQKALGDDNRKIALPKMSERDAHWHEPRSYKKSYVEQSEFKDVFEDTINKSGSNDDSAMEVLQQSDSLFLEHLRMQKSPSSYGYNRIAVLKPSNSTNQKTKDKGRKDEREGPMKDGFVRHTCNSHGSQSLFKSSIITPDREGESDIMAKRIVILKPNYVKSQNAFNPFSSPDSSQFNFPVYSEHKQYEDSSREGYYRNMDIFKDVDISRRKSREVTKTVKKASREMRDTYSCMKNRRNTAKESNGEMFEDFGYMTNNFPSPFRGSPDIRDLYDFSGNVSASELEETKLTCDFTESFASNEAKKRLLERLKKAYNYQDVTINYQDVIVNSKRSMPRDMYQDAGMDGKKITLGEMLSTSDKKIRNLDVTMGGISSKDGWKDSYSKFSSRSRSIFQLPGIASEKHNADGECRVDDKLLVPKEDTYQYQRKVVDRDCKKKENSSSKNSRSSNRRSQSNRQRYRESYSSYDQMETNLNKEVSPDKQPVVPQTSKNAASIADAADIIQHGCRIISPRSSDELPTELSIFEKNSDDSSVGNKEDSTPQLTKAEAEFSESSKEADHPSPVSVLQVPIREDDMLSGPESFEQVSADLRELQKQLQLLRRESKLDEGDSTPPDNDYDIQQGSVVDFENRRVHKPEWWESSYIVDVLNESGFANTDADMFTTICYSPDCPLGPWVFDNLESKHYGEVTRLKHDRRLLFDRINSALSAMPKSFAEPCPWVRPSTVGIRFKWQACEIREELYKLLEGQVKEANEEDSEKLLDKEMNWVGLRDSVDAIGMKIEKLLTDELLTELLNDVKFSN